jgi:drug/metabolite transporter (DMT)-like permease
MGQHLITGILILAAVTFTVTANLVLKTGTQQQGFGTLWPLTVVNTQTIVSASAFALAFLFYAMLLKRIPLSLAQAILSVQFVLVILAANVLLDEQVGWIRWIGIALVAAGLIVVGLSPDSPLSGEPSSARR